jgi:hypothetical protein
MYTLNRCHLGPGLGIREIVAARSGFLIIAGNAGSDPSETYPESADYDEGRGFLIFHWDSASGEAHSIGAIPDPAGKAEAMTILGESEEHIDVLILFDGADNGEPSVYRIS